MSNHSLRFAPGDSPAQNITLVGASSSRYEEDWLSIPHSHDYTELFYVREGKGRLLVNNSEYSIARDDLIIINPHLCHTEISTGSIPLSYYTVGVDGICFSFSGQQDFRIFNCRGKQTDLLFYFNTIYQELDRQAEGYAMICRNMLEILTIQLRRITDSAFEVIPARHPTRECAMIRRYLDSHYSEPITLDTLSQLTHLNKHHPSHEFSKYYGISPISYLNRRRLEMCMELLENTDYGIAEIAGQTGFSSQSYLSQSFRRFCGITAAQYRRQAKKRKQT